MMTFIILIGDIILDQLLIEFQEMIQECKTIKFTDKLELEVGRWELQIIEEVEPINLVV